MLFVLHGPGGGPGGVPGSGPDPHPDPHGPDPRGPGPQGPSHGPSHGHGGGSSVSSSGSSSSSGGTGSSISSSASSASSSGSHGILASAHGTPVSGVGVVVVVGALLLAFVAACHRRRRRVPPSKAGGDFRSALTDDADTVASEGSFDPEVPSDAPPGEAAEAGPSEPMPRDEDTSSISTAPSVWSEVSEPASSAAKRTSSLAAIGAASTLAADWTRYRAPSPAGDPTTAVVL